MAQPTLLRILRIASALFINIVTGYFGVSIFAPVFTGDIRPDVVILTAALRANIAVAD